MTVQTDSRILHALTGHILKHRPTSYAAITAAQTLMLIGLWDVFPHGILITWYLAMQVIAIPHLIICIKFAGKELSESQVRFIKTVFILYALASSTQWASLTWLLTDKWDIHSFIVLLPLLGIFAGAINTAAILPIYFCLIMPILVQSLYVLFFTEASDPLIAGLFVIYYGGMIKFALELNKMLVRTYSMQFELGSANRELILQKKAAEKANMDKSRFLAAASHDLRQPLYAMELFLGGLTQACNTNDTNQSYLLSRLRYALDSMRNMFSSLLDMSRFDAGVITPKYQNFSVSLLLNTIRFKFSEEFEKKGLKLIVRSCDHWVYSDPILVQRVLENYVSNALKYTDSGGVLLACRTRGNNVRLEVWDTGRGIKESEFSTIFDAFHQLDNPERDREKGVGLGLSIVHQISSLLNAPVTVNSKYGKGSLFTITVPPGEMDVATDIEEDHHLEIVDDVFLDLAVWIVDDDVNILEGLQLQLESWGCITRTFESPDQISEFTVDANDPPDLLITDLRLRKHKSGLDVIKMLSDRFSADLPAIIITGDTGPNELRTINETGTPILHKPVTAAILQQTIATILQERKLTSIQ